MCIRDRFLYTGLATFARPAARSAYQSEDSRPMLTLTGKVFVVAGAGSGIGEATAQTLARHGARVVVGDHRPGAAHEVARRINASGCEASAQAFDITDETSVRALIASAVDRYGALDGIHVLSL